MKCKPFFLNHQSIWHVKNLDGFKMCLIFKSLDQQLLRVPAGVVLGEKTHNITSNEREQMIRMDSETVSTNRNFK